MEKIEPKIFDELKTALVSFGNKYFVGEELNRSKLTDDLRNYDEALLSKLFEVDFIKQHFIKEVAGQKLFQIEQLEEAVLYNDYWDTSYTKYENRVGLASKGKFLQDSQDVVLDFPFKDGVLTASMTKEDNEDGYDDAFLNEVSFLISLAGTPPTRELSGTSFVTTAPAAITTLLPMVIPGRMVTLPPIHTSLPIRTGSACAI